MRPPAESAMCLVHVALQYERSVGCCTGGVLGTYLTAAPFDVATVPSIDRHTAQPATPPEEIQRVLYR